MGRDHGMCSDSSGRPTAQAACSTWGEPKCIRPSPRIVPDVHVWQLRPHALLQLQDHVELRGTGGGQPEFEDRTHAACARQASWQFHSAGASTSITTAPGALSCTAHGPHHQPATCTHTNQATTHTPAQQ